MTSCPRCYGSYVSRQGARWLCWSCGEWTVETRRDPRESTLAEAKDAIAHLRQLLAGIDHQIPRAAADAAGTG